MNYQEYLDNEKKLSKKNDLEYLKIKEEIKQALSNVERKTREYKTQKEKEEQER